MTVVLGRPLPPATSEDILASYRRRSRGAVSGKRVTQVPFHLPDPGHNAILLKTEKVQKLRRDRRKRAFETRHNCQLGHLPRPPCPYPSFWEDRARSITGAPLLDIVPVPSTETTDRTEMRSDLVELFYGRPDGFVDIQQAVRLLSYPRKRNQQLRRETALHLAGHVDLGDASVALTGHKYMAAATNGFLDIPGCLFSIRHRAWANQRIAKVVADGIPPEKFSFLTLLAGVVPSLSVAPFNTPGWMRDQALDMLIRIGRALRNAGAKWVYLNGFWEMIDKDGLFDTGIKYRKAWQGLHWKGQHRRYLGEQQFVPHLHGLLLAHDGRDWMPGKDLYQVLRREFSIPQEVMLTRRKLPSKYNAMRVMAYANKPPSSASIELMVEDALMRDQITKNDLWPEGWFWFGDVEPSMPPEIEARIKARQIELTKLSLLGAAVGFDLGHHRWPWVGRLRRRR